MEKGIDWELDFFMQELFQMREVDVREYSPLALAYLGDAVFDLVVRSLVLNKGNKPVQKLCLLYTSPSPRDI